MKNKNLIKNYIFLTVYDIIVVFASSLLSALLLGNVAFLFAEPTFYIAVAISAVVLWISFYGFHLYHSNWRYVSVAAIVKICLAVAFTTVVQGLEAIFMNRSNDSVSPAYFFLVFLIMIILTFIPRGSKKIFRALKYHIALKNNDSKKAVLIVGAGDAGATLIREINNSDKVNCKVCCIVDDDYEKLYTYLYDIRIEGTRGDIPELVKKYYIDEIYIAIPSAGGEAINEISEICHSTGCTVKVLPGVYQLMNGEAFLGKLKEVSIEELLSRESVDTNIESAITYVSNQVVMVTGGGGSIGSELCRQIASHAPNKLIIVDIYENNAYDIQQELIKNYPALDLEVLIASVRDEQRMEHIFSTYRPQIVFHAAAHKHVPLMEDSPNEAIKNNTFGTFKTAKLADKYGVKTFVLISTDKAVNPTNVMGASKRMCEMVIQSFAKISKTKFVAVRFGNVLGSNGSVVPLFKKQIAAGGPVLVTHPDIIRYFMTIPEAVALVIQAGAYANGGEIFVLDMGKPVKILDMAEKMIRLSGYTPYKDIDIKFTGLRPGEKLYEEMLMEEEGLQETENKLIHIGKPIEMDEEKFFADLKELKAVLDTEPDNARELISKMVPTYTGNKDLKNI